MWVFRTRGSGVWANIGNTIVFPTPKNMSKVHHEAIEFLSKDCKAWESFGENLTAWPRYESVIFGDCAREKGYDSVQFEPQSLHPFETFNMIDEVEMVLTRLDGQYACGTKDASKTTLRSGWMASRSCKCENPPLPDNCGLAVPGLTRQTDPPLCKDSSKEMCDMSACPISKCEIPSHSTTM